MNNQMSRRSAREGAPQRMTIPRARTTSPLCGEARIRSRPFLSAREGAPKALTSPLSGEARIKSRPFLSAREGAPKA